jgi:hypothetical protein
MSNQEKLFLSLRLKVSTVKNLKSMEIFLELIDIQMSRDVTLLKIIKIISKPNNQL